MSIHIKPDLFKSFIEKKALSTKKIIKEKTGIFCDNQCLVQYI